MKALRWLDRNLLTVAGLLLAFAAFAADVGGALPPKWATVLSSASLIAVAAARGLVHAAEKLRANPEDEVAR